MATVEICVEIEEEALRAYEAEARRQGITVRCLVERMVNGLLRDMEREEDAGTDHPIIAS
jgi:hypothetical protein